MARITIEDSLKVAKTRFGLVLLASKRARQLLKGSKPLMESKNHDGLLLDTGAPHWQIGAEGLRAVKEFIGNVVAC